MEDHHVDRPAVEAQQCVKPTGTNRSFGLIHSHRMQRSRSLTAITNTKTRHESSSYPAGFALRRPGGYGEGTNTRSHPELGRENPQRQWYCVLRRGRVGRRQVFTTQKQANTTKLPARIPHNPSTTQHPHAGWTSPSAKRRKPKQTGRRANISPDQTR